MQLVLSVRHRQDVRGISYIVRMWGITAKHSMSKAQQSIKYLWQGQCLTKRYIAKHNSILGVVMMGNVRDKSCSLYVTEHGSHINMLNNHLLATKCTVHY